MLTSRYRIGLRATSTLSNYDGETVFHHACKLGLEGIVSSARKQSPYRSRRSSDWVKMKNPACEAVTREEEEDWAGDRKALTP